jgi:hypothetical protein
MLFLFVILLWLGQLTITLPADTRNTKNLGTKQGAEQALDDTDYAQADIDLGGELDLDISDLAMDDEEIPVGTNPTDFIAMAREAIEEFSRYN